MKQVFAWLEQRLGVIGVARALLFHAIPGGARWRHVWGSAVLFAFAVQAVTGFFLWTNYSSSAQTAWESVYYIQHEMKGGWLLRGLHHYFAQAFVVLLVAHLVQMVIFRAYRAPRELNFWIALLLLPLAVGMSVTGWLLPFDQHGFWAARVPLNLLAATPVIGPFALKVLIGGSDFGHLTITRFLALHAGLLPVCITFLLALWVYLPRKGAAKDGGGADEAATKPAVPWWPDQALRDAVVCLAVLIGVLFLILRPWLLHGGEPGAALGAPADPSETYSAARPEWFFLFLFQFLKYFPGTSEIIGAMIIPGLVFTVFLLMPFIAKWRFGHRFNVLFVGALLAGAVVLTWLAVEEDRNDPTYRAAVAEAHRAARRAPVLAGGPGGIPTTGAITLVRNDAYLQGPRLFAKHCANCHRYDGHDALGRVPKDPPSAPDLKGFASREWIAGLLDPAKVDSPQYFGGTKFKNGKMSRFVKNEIAGFNDTDKENLRKIILALSAQANLKSQRDLDKRDLRLIKEGDKLFLGDIGCGDCHRYGSAPEESSGPSLVGYGSRAWLIAFISNPSHIRFYGKRNDRMPAFGDDQLLDAPSIAMLADWLRGEWYEPAPKAD
jgi:ubiquinol-cytochrome c reductase cytochrome b subunit